MKAILKFKLPKEQHEFKNATEGAIYKHILWEIKENYRSKLKYGELNESEYKIIEECSEFFWNLVNSENIDVDS